MSQDEPRPSAIVVTFEAEGLSPYVGGGYELLLSASQSINPGKKKVVQPNPHAARYPNETDPDLNILALLSGAAHVQHKHGSREVRTGRVGERGEG